MNADPAGPPPEEHAAGHPTELLPGPGGRICVVLLSGIGDVVHGLPLVNVLADRRPDVEIVWVAEPTPAEVLRHHPSIDRTLVFRKQRGVRGVLRLLRELRVPGGFDLTLNVQRYFKSVFPTLLSRASVRIGLPRDKTRDGVSLVHTHHLPDGPWKHTQELFLDFLDPLGIPRPDPPEWRITFSEDEEAAARAWFAEFEGRPRVGLVTGTASPEKDWPRERYPPLADALDRDLGFDVFLLGGPGDRERATAAHTTARAASRPIAALADSVRDLMWRIRGMDLVISPDTGPVHLARAMEVPVIGLYGHTNPWRVGPYRGCEDLVVDRYTAPGETPDPSRYGPRPGRMERISVEEVVERVERAQARYGIGDRAA